MAKGKSPQRGKRTPNDDARSDNPSQPRVRNSPGLTDVFKIAAARIGSGERPVDVAADLGVTEGRLSQLKWGTDRPSREYQRLLKAANEQALALVGTKMLQRLERILDAGQDKDAVGAARELENMRKNLLGVQTDLAKLEIERERLQIQRQQADATTNALNAAQPSGLVILPAKDIGAFGSTDTPPGG